MEFQDKETLELIQQTARDANGAKDKVVVIDLPDEPEGVYGLVKASGVYERVVACQPPREQILAALDQVPIYVEDAKNRLSLPEGMSDCQVVWYNRKGVVVLLSDESLGSDLRNRATLTFRETEELEFIRGLAKTPQWLEPKPFLRMLRLHLSQCLSDKSGNLTKQLKSLRFTSNSSGRSEVGSSKSTLGREIEEEVRSEFGELPEVVELSIRVIDDPALKVRRTVRCVLETDALAGTLCLFPEAGQLAKAIDEEMQGIGELLRRSCDVPVFHGET